MSIRKILPVFLIIVLLLSSCATPATQAPAAEAPSAEQPVATEAPAEPVESEAPAATEPPAAEEPEATEAPAVEAGPAVLRIGWAGSPDTLNPGPAVLTEAYILFELVYDSNVPVGAGWKLLT